jgi:hypothetical protein
MIDSFNMMICRTGTSGETSQNSKGDMRSATSSACKRTIADSLECLGDSLVWSDSVCLWET